MSDSHAIELSDADWARLTEMRAGFLAAGDRAPGAGLPDYWRSRRDLEIYDATFGARIGWKWNAVLDDLERRRVVAPGGHLVDFGAGTGVAARAWLARRGRSATWRVHVVERSPAAAAFARDRISAEHPTIALDDEPCGEPDVLLVSHVLDELDAAARARLVELARRSRFVVWLEGAAKATARALSSIRDELRPDLAPVAPCTHADPCPLLDAAHASDWCHHFARPAPEAFTTRHWRRFSAELGLDLRALPYAYLVLAARDAARTPPPGLARVLGRPRVGKGHVDLQVCADGNVATVRFLERTDKRLAREFADAAGTDLVLRLEVEGRRVVRAARAADRAGIEEPG